MNNTTANVTSSYDPLDEPPPYTPRADPSQGETVVEFGPSRPFQRPPPRPDPTPVVPPRPVQPTFLSPQTTSRSTGGLWRQLSGQIEQMATQIERQATGAVNRYAPPSHTTGSSSWLTYPGRSNPLPYNVPVTSSPSPALQVPPRHPSPSSSPSLPEDTSGFSRDFYAAGTGDGVLNLETDSNRTPRNRSAPPGHPPDERGPTTTPIPGRPLLHEGNLLVYPKGHTCSKCHNTGYKHYDPLRPCRKCWSKYSKPFSGPLAYSYSSTPSAGVSNTQNTNLQKPLPHHVSGPPSTRRAVPPPLPPRRASFSEYRPPPQNAYFNRGPMTTTLPGLAPPPGSMVYRPGDPRIGGMLCWLCHGKGTMDIFIDVINCPTCGGCGRTF